MEKVQKTKKHKSVMKIIGYIVDVAVYPVIFLAFFSSFFMLISRSGDKVTPLFGYGFVRVLSGSMIKSDFLINDVVIVGPVDSSQIRVGDIIAYYDYADRTITETVSLYEGETYKDEKTNVSGLVTDENGVPIYNEKLYQTIKNAKLGETYFNGKKKLEIPSERVSTEIAIEKSSKVNFHMVVNIFVDQTGTLYFETRGTSNLWSDSYKIREDLVAGRYITTPREFRDVVRFCASTQGMLLIVVVPLSIIVFLELLSVFEQIANLLLEKKVLKRSAKITDKDVIKANIGIEMRDFDKAFFYDVMPLDKKQEVFEFLWGYYKDSNKKKIQKLYKIASAAVEVYDFESPQKYWEVFISSYKNKAKKSKYEKAERSAKDNKYLPVEIIEYSNNKEQIEKTEIIEQAKQNIEQQVGFNIDGKPVEKIEEQKPVVTSSQSPAKSITDKRIEEVLKRAEELLKNKNKPTSNSDK